jgi:hypothetical protein
VISHLNLNEWVANPHKILDRADLLETEWVFESSKESSVRTGIEAVVE